MALDVCGGLGMARLGLGRTHVSMERAGQDTSGCYQAGIGGKQTREPGERREGRKLRSSKSMAEAAAGAYLQHASTSRT